MIIVFGGGDVAFFSFRKILGQSLTIYSMFALFFKVEFSSCTPVQLFKPESARTGSAS